MKKKFLLGVLLISTTSCNKILNNIIEDAITTISTRNDIFNQLSTKNSDNTSYTINLSNVKSVETLGNNDGILNQNEISEVTFSFTLKNNIVEKKTEPTTNTKIESKENKIDKIENDKPDFVIAANNPDYLKIKIINESSFIKFNTTEFEVSNLSKIESPSIKLEVKNVGQVTKKAPISIIITDNNGNTTNIKAELIISPINNKFTVSDWNIDDYYGNNDNIANRGENIHIYPVLRNSGKSPTNNISATLTFKENTLLEFSQLKKEFNYKKIKAFSESIEKEDEPININISKNFIPNTYINAKLEVKDDFENHWEEDVSFKVEKIANELTIKKLEYLDENGNQDFLPNRGERVRLRVTLENKGTSPTNDLLVTMNKKDKPLLITKNMMDIKRFGANRESSLSENYSVFELPINSIVGEGFPVSFKIEDDFNNSWNDLRLINVAPSGYNLSITKMDIEEITSTNNKRRFKITPYFRNIGVSNSELNFVSALVANEDAEIIEKKLDTFITSIKRGEIQKVSNSFIVQINTDKKFNLKIPIIFYLENKFENKSEILYNLDVF